MCTWTDQMQPQQTVAGRVLKPTALGSGKMAKNSDVQSRLDRLELLLERAVTGQAQIAPQSVRSSIDYERKESDAQLTPSSNSQTSHGGGITSDDGDGTLLLDGGQSQFVSSLHYALLADEVRTFPESFMMHTANPFNVLQVYTLAFQPYSNLSLLV